MTDIHAKGLFRNKMSNSVDCFCTVPKFVSERRGLYVAVDVDGTLTHSNVSFAFGRFLYSKGAISFFQAFMSALYYGAHSIGLLSVDRLHRLIFRTLFLGRKKELMEAVVDEFFELYGEQLIREQIREEVLSLRNHGAKIAILSSSPDFLVKGIARTLSIEEWYATEYVVDERGCFSSIGRVVTGSVKAQIVRDVKKRDGCSVMAMTDSMLDGPLLEEAESVVAVFPDRRLKRLAKKRGWRIVQA